MAVDHGGRLNAAIRHWGGHRAQWLDLSTGLNPWPWPVPLIPEHLWHRLPEEDDGLETVIRRWLGVPAAAAVLPVPGSQAAIQRLPCLRAAGRVAVPAPGYAEHGYRWKRAGHLVEEHPSSEMESAVDRVDVLVWIQPNNPDGARLPPATLLDWQRRLAARGGWLVVDEAFVDPTPEYSLAASAGAPGLVLLRSLGKFFGLAGVRCGVVAAEPSLCEALGSTMGPWAVSGPGRWIMRQAMADEAWQAQTVARLREGSRRLAALLTAAGLTPAAVTSHFCYCTHPRAAVIRDGLGARNILVRHFAEPPALRFGLPPDVAAEARLRDALAVTMARLAK